MKAVVATKYGGPAVLALVDRPTPEVGPRDVLIAVTAASLNPVDAKIRDGQMKLVLALKPPIALGCDVAGIVTAKGAEVTKFAVGDEVYARLEKLRMGGLAEQVAADEAVVARKPPSLSFAEAASLPLVALTALQALREYGAFTKGQRVLITAGAGGVGTVAIQLAKILGLHVITTTSTKNVDFVKSLGADEVIDYTTTTLPIADFDGVFQALDTGELDSIRATKRGGTVVGIATVPDGAFAKTSMPAWSRPIVWLLGAKRRRVAAKAGVTYRWLFMRPDAAQLDELTAWVESKQLRPVLHKTYPFEQFREAFAELERGKSRGKIVVTV